MSEVSKVADFSQFIPDMNFSFSSIVDIDKKARNRTMPCMYL